jgi:hypothetical protein
MQPFTNTTTHRRFPIILIGAACVLGLTLGLLFITLAGASTPLIPGPGYLDFAFGPDTGENTTGDKPESKLWWNDGYWWGSLYNQTAGEYHIYRLDWGEQDWVDTGVALDDRPGSRADVLWDEDAGKLYVVSHIYSQFSKKVNNTDEWARLYRYSYDAATETYSLDPGFGSSVNPNEDQSEALVLDKDSTGRLWTAFVSREADNQPYQVYVNATDAGDDDWQTRFPLTTYFTQAVVDNDDIASVISFRDDTGDKIGVMWTNQISGTESLNFATHLDSNADYDTDWSLISVPVPLEDPADDHISMKAVQQTTSGQVFAVIKTNPAEADDPLILVVARDSDGTFSFHEYSLKAGDDTRPILLVDEGDLGNSNDDKIYVFVTGKAGGGKVCYKSLSITNPLNSMGDFPNLTDCGTDFLEDDIYDNIDNTTSTKQNVNATTGIVILASDEDNGEVYVHNVLGNPPPVITSRSPDQGATDVALGAVVRATFSKSINPATLTGASFALEGTGGPVSGSVSYDNTTRTATFTPDSPLDATTVHTATVTNGVQDTGGQALFATEIWSFTTGETPVIPTVQFDQASYSVNEDGLTATITVTLDITTTLPVSVTYQTSNDTATAGSDYTAVSDVLTFDPGETSQTFNVAITDDALDEPNENLNLTLSGPENAVLGAPSSAVLTIVDNDAPVTVQFDAATYSVEETAGTATITVTLSAPSGLAVEVDYATSAGTATAEDDYTSKSDRLLFAPGETSQTFSITIMDDTEAEGDETVNLTLSNPDDATLGDPATATLTILDDEQPEPTLITIYLPLISK